MSEDGRITVRSPRTPLPSVSRIPLAPRPHGDLEAVTVCVVQTMPSGNGLEPIVASLLQMLPHGMHVRRDNFMTDDPGERARIRDQFDAAIIAVGPSTTILEVSLTYATALEADGIPVALVVFDGLRNQLDYLSRQTAARLRVHVVSQDASADRSEGLRAALDSLVRPLEAEEVALGVLRRSDGPERVTGRPATLHEEFHQRGWTDGLPIILPTDARVEDMLTGTSRSADEVVSPSFVPERRTATVAHVATVAVMAGARPEHLPVILAAASLMSAPTLEPMTRSVNSFAFGQLVSGPIAREIGMNGAGGALGPGNRANAAIGRSLQLMIRNLGGAREGLTISQTQGAVPSWAFAFTENADVSPWPEFHVARGWTPDVSTLSLFTGGMSHLGNFYYDDVDEIGRALTAVDQLSGALVLLSAKRAHELAARGMSAADVVARIAEHARIPLGRFRSSGFFPMRSTSIRNGTPGSWPASYLTDPDETVVAAFPPGSVHVAVVGSEAASVAQAWHLTLTGIVSVDDWR